MPPDGQGAIRLTASAPHYVVVQDLIIDMRNQTRGPQEGGPDGVYVSGGAHHNRFQRLEVKNNTVNGFQFSNNNGNSPFNEVLDCSIHDNGRADGVNHGYGAYVFTSDNLFVGNDVYNNGGYGLHFFNNGGPYDVSRNVIRNNRIHDNGTHGGSNYGIVVAWGDKNTVQDNSIVANGGGVLVYVNSTNAVVANNTITSNRPGEGILIQYASGTVVRDNVVYDNATDIVDLGTGTIFSNNHAQK
jgi:parallel beta-helix repeat protein